MNILDEIVKYFDLVSHLRGKIESANLPPAWPQYLALVLGIIIQPYFAHYQQTQVWMVQGIFGRIIFALIVALAIFPAVYKNTFDPTKPMFVQFCTIFVSGLGWESLLATAIEAVS